MTQCQPSITMMWLEPNSTKYPCGLANTPVMVKSGQPAPIHVIECHINHVSPTSDSMAMTYVNHESAYAVKSTINPTFQFCTLAAKPNPIPYSGNVTKSKIYQTTPPPPEFPYNFRSKVAEFQNTKRSQKITEFDNVS